MSEQKTKAYVYWMAEKNFGELKKLSASGNIKLKSALMTPCEALRAKGDNVYYVNPSVWSKVCKRQGSWYRASKKQGLYLVVSPKELPVDFDNFFEVSISESGFKPGPLPTAEEMKSLVDSKEYTNAKPREWEAKGIMDAVMFKILFSVTGFWGIGDNLKKHWLSHKANHANFLVRKFTTNLDGTEVPYSIAENTGICSSCVEFFNIIEERSRKLVRSCPGAVTFGKAKRDIFYDINPAK